MFVTCLQSLETCDAFVVADFSKTVLHLHVVRGSPSSKHSRLFSPTDRTAAQASEFDASVIHTGSHDAAPLPMDIHCFPRPAVNIASHRIGRSSTKVPERAYKPQMYSSIRGLS